MMFLLLIVEHNIWEPNMLGWDMKMFDPSVVTGRPLELVVDPLLLDPHVGDHDLPLHVDPDDLGQLQAHLHSQAVRAVTHRTNQSGQRRENMSTRKKNSFDHFSQDFMCCVLQLV